MNAQKIAMILLLTLLLAGCTSPAPAPAAPPTQPPPTLPPAPTPTPEPTPIPYNLDLLVTGPDGQPIPGASAQLGEQTQQAGSSGVITFADLSAGPLALTVSSPGYLSQDISPSLQPGDNQLEIALQPDPFGLLPANACAQGETLLYLEDFQDGQAQGWDAFENQIPGWTIEEDANQPGNRLAAARSQQSMPWAWYDRQNAAFENVIWRLRVKPMGKGHTQLNFRFVEQPDYSGRYFIGIGGGGAILTRYENNQGDDISSLGDVKPGQWRLFEIGYLDGALTVFVDGEQRATYQESTPWQGGAINLEPHPEAGGPGEGAFFYDDLSICGLTAPPQPLPKPKTGYDLSLTVTGAEGQPLSLASVSLLDADGQPVGDALTPDAAGMLALSDLPTGVIQLAVSAPGYLPQEQGLIIEKGEPAALILTLERDTLGLAPIDACASDEKLLYIEDFNDGMAQGWQNVSAGSNTQNGWTILEQPNGNMLLQAANGLGPAADYLEGAVFDDAVWRLKVYYEGSDTDGFLNWRQSFVDPSGAHGDWRYILPFGGPHLLEIIRFARGEAVQAAQSNLQLAPEQWYLFEISAYQGVAEVWLDGQRLFSYTDPQPLPPGTIGLEMHLRPGVKTVFWFDDMAVCGLSAPFVPLARAP